MAEKKVIDVRADYYHLSRGQQPESGATLGPTAVHRVGTRTVKLADANLSRKRIIIENRGTGVLYIGASQHVSSYFGTGILLRAGETLIDEYPFAHLGEWWGASDSDATVAVTEVT